MGVKRHNVAETGSRKLRSISTWRHLFILHVCSQNGYIRVRLIRVRAVLKSLVLMQRKESFEHGREKLPLFVGKRRGEPRVFRCLVTAQKSKASRTHRGTPQAAAGRPALRRMREPILLQRDFCGDPILEHIPLCGRRTSRGPPAVFASGASVG